MSLPAAAQAYGMSGGGHGGCGYAGSVLFAALAVLGYWVLQHAGKETASYIKRTGIVLGITLLVIGLLGLLCGVGSHISQGMSRSCAAPVK